MKRQKRRQNVWSSRTLYLIVHFIETQEKSFAIKSRANSVAHYSQSQSDDKHLVAYIHTYIHESFRKILLFLYFFINIPIQSSPSFVHTYIHVRYTQDDRWCWWWDEMTVVFIFMLPFFSVIVDVCRFYLIIQCSILCTYSLLFLSCKDPCKTHCCTKSTIFMFSEYFWDWDWQIFFFGIVYRKSMKWSFDFF